MERTKQLRKPDLILTSDWHLREDTPVCRTDDFWDAQWRKVAFVAGLQQKYECPVIHAGDLFDHWKPSPNLLTHAVTNLPKQFYTIYGQHDLPQHSLDLNYKSGMKTLESAGIVNILPGYHFGQTPNGTPSMQVKGLNILVWHHLTYVTKPYPEATGGMVEGLIRKHPEYDLIITGDNHTSFSVKSYEKQLLVNPGNLTRQTADQIDYKPRVALWYAEDNSIEWIPLPIQSDVISRGHIDIKEQRDQRIQAFVSKLNGDWQAELSFEDNLNRFFETNPTREETKQIIYKAIEK